MIMTKWFLKILVCSVNVFILAYILPGVSIVDFFTAVMVAVVLSLLDAVVKPLLILLTLPATILTLGLFLFVIIDRRGAAETYVRITREKISVDEILELINNPEFEFTMTPKNLMKIVGFMSEVGHIKVKPESWKDLFFPEVHNLPGS